MIKKLASLLALTLAGVTSLSAATWYVDSTATGGAKNGTSWANAWTSISSVSGVGSGDTVYISGGPSGSSQSYSVGTWSPVSGVTYKIGQDSAHNGTANLSCSGVFLNPANNVAIVGDAGDGQQHFSVSGVTTIMWISGGHISNFRLGYINFGSINGSGNNPEDVMYVNSISGFEFDHNYVNLASPNCNAFAYMVITDSTWDGSRIHDNTWYMQHNFGIGPDTFELGGSSGYSIYNNKVYSTAGSVSSQGQHQDFWQDTGGSSYIKIYNNYLEGQGNSCFFADGYYGGFNHLWIYNNVGIQTTPIANGWYPEGCTVRPDGDSSTKAFNDVQVMNNTFVDMGAEPGISVNANFYGSGYSATFTGCNVANNIVINSGQIQSDPGVGNSANMSYHITSNNGDFVRYVPNSSGNDFHLTSAAGDLIGKGVNESTYFTTDNQGLTRTVWDIGAYSFGGVASAYLSVAPVTDDVTDVVPSQPGIHAYEGTTVHLSDTIAYTGSNSVNWQWSYTVNGGSPVNLSSGTGTTVAGISYTIPTGSAGSTYAWKLSATAGTNSASGTSRNILVVAQSGSGGTTNPPPAYQPPVVSAITQNATDVVPNTPAIDLYENTAVIYSATATSPVGNPLTWQWTFSFNGGAPVVFASGSGTVLAVNQNYGTGSAGTYVWTLKVSDGQTNVSSAPMTVIVMTPPTAPAGLTFSATNGVLSGPFQVANGYVYQNVQTTVVTNAGKAVYNFSITNAGSYVIQTMVNSPSDAANSFYVNIDAMPVDPTMIWDTPITSGFQLQLVSWRGLGTDTAPQYAPKIFTLGAGSHQLIICGREANAQLQSISILKVPAPPQGLSVVSSN